MSGFSHLPLQLAIYQALQADSELLNLVTGVYDHVPEKTDFPYVAITELKGLRYSALATDGMEFQITIDVLSRKAGQKQAAAIMDRVYQVLHQANLTVADQTLVFLQYQSSNIDLLNDGVTYQGQMRFYALTIAD